MYLNFWVPVVKMCHNVCWDSDWDIVCARFYLAETQSKFIVDRHVLKKGEKSRIFYLHCDCVFEECMQKKNTCFVFSHVHIFCLIDPKAVSATLLWAGRSKPEGSSQPGSFPAELSCSWRLSEQQFCGEQPVSGADPGKSIPLCTCCILPNYFTALESWLRVKPRWFWP